MGGKKMLIIVAIVGVATFAGSFFLSKTFFPKESPTSAPVASQPAEKPPELAITPAASDQLTVKESQLDDLIREYLQKRKEQSVAQEELLKRQAEVTGQEEVLRSSAQELDKQRIELVDALVQLRRAVEQYNKDRILMGQQEMIRLKKLASVYDAMEASSGSKILESMCGNKQEDDAVKILYLMKERSAAKMLTEMTDKNLSARLTGKMKKIKDES